MAVDPKKKGFIAKWWGKYKDANYTAKKHTEEISEIDPDRQENHDGGHDDLKQHPEVPPGASPATPGKVTHAAPPGFEKRKDNRAYNAQIKNRYIV